MMHAQTYLVRGRASLDRKVVVHPLGPAAVQHRDCLKVIVCAVCVVIVCVL
jgi:hypothetical protein